MYALHNVINEIGMLKNDPIYSLGEAGKYYILVLFATTREHSEKVNKIINLCPVVRGHFNFPLRYDDDIRAVFTTTNGSRNSGVYKSPRVST